MAGESGQQDLFGAGALGEDDVVVINERCRVRTRDGYRVVSVSGLVLAHYEVGDRLGETHAIVSLVEQGWAQQSEVARAFGCSQRTVRRQQRRFEAGGLAALGQPRGYPQGRPRSSGARSRRVNHWKAQGVGNREIARRLGISEKAVRKLVGRLGWGAVSPEPRALELESADPKLSGAPIPLPVGAQSPATPDPRNEGPGAPQSAPVGAQPEPAGETSCADPKLSALVPSSAHERSSARSLDSDPADRSLDRLLACLGLLDDAEPRFRNARDLPGAGVLLAIPALIDSGVFEIARQVYGSLGPAFYGLRTTLATLLLMALLRIQRPEALKEHSPEVLGRLLGLDRAPEVKTLRRKLTRLAAVRRSVEFGRALAQRRVAMRGPAMGFLYLDGHVRVYHGRRTLPKAHVARMRLSMPATTDYWLNDAQGEPLFVLTTEANPGLVQILPAVLDEIRVLVGERRVTIVFDRGGFSPKLFQQLIARGFDLLTYRKGRFPRVPKNQFHVQEGTLDGRPICYRLADQEVRLLKGKLRLRQVTRLSPDGHQTPILTSRRDLPALEIAYRMFERWRQENFFKYLREEYALDALVDYDTEPADARRPVPNPKRKELDARIRAAYAELGSLSAEHGLDAFDNLESARRSVRGFKIAHAKIRQQISAAMKRIAQLEKQRASVPTHVPVAQAVEGEIVKLSVERKHLTDLLKMVAYQAESDLVRLVAPHYRRAEDEGRTLIQSALAAAGNLDLAGDELRVDLVPLSSPHRTQALARLCEQLNETPIPFPGTKLRLRFTLQPDPPSSMAFPGPRTPQSAPQPDISCEG
jgi:DNA-binding CsgD family transcriptional regulator